MTNEGQTTQNSGKHLSLTIKCKVAFRQDSDFVYYKQAFSYQFQYFIVSSHDMHLIDISREAVWIKQFYSMYLSVSLVNTKSINKGLVLYTSVLT